MFFNSLFHNSLKVLPIFLFFIFITPIILVLSSLFYGYSDNWFHLYNYVLSEYIINSIFLILGVSFFVVLIGVLSSWLVTNYDFFGKSFFEWALILPLAIPPYILAYTFTEIFDTYGSANTLLNNIFLFDEKKVFFPSVRNIYGAIAVFSFTLYPYVYLVSRMAFVNQSISIIEAGRILGLSRVEAFFKLSIPLIRPAILAGLALVIMETLSDFGAVEHFAIATFTTGIFRTWYGMYDLNTAMQLASLLLIFVTIFLVFERLSRKKAAFVSSNSLYKKHKVMKLKGSYSFFAMLFCLIPVFIGFILPIIELINWTINYKLDFFNRDFLKSSFNSLLLALITAFLCTIIAFLINFTARYQGNKLLSFLSSTLMLGYAVPGLILAIGITQLLIIIDNSFNLFKIDIVLTGSLIGLIIAYIIKSYALSNSTIESGFQRVSNSLDDVSKTLNISGIKLMYKIHFPLLRTGLLTSILLVGSEVIKELPATLILRPFNFETLAVSAYNYASEERMYEAAAPSIAIVIVGLLPIIILSRMIKNSRPGEILW
ncbi:MAG: iron ABC transporter permease [Rhizobiales bacterium TMED94]|nr:iron ABC transporter permease [Rhodobiaceae bacterium]RPF88222.1 MAG: iron ABC transporter permease [Rhizobiales bacterium TMED94]|tara:strand:+ start:9870 stop:11501 length:1632 start_codon:yes stop_codon:yes gene_type:complete